MEFTVGALHDAFDVAEPVAALIVEIHPYQAGNGYCVPTRYGGATAFWVVVVAAGGLPVWTRFTGRALSLDRGPGTRRAPEADVHQPDPLSMVLMAVALEPQSRPATGSAENEAATKVQRLAWARGAALSERTRRSPSAPDGVDETVDVDARFNRFRDCRIAFSLSLLPSLLLSRSPSLLSFVVLALSFLLLARLCCSAVSRFGACRTQC